MTQVGIANAMGTDFNLYSTFDDAWNETNPWQICSFNENDIGFPNNCGPDTYFDKQSGSKDLKVGSSNNFQVNFKFSFIKFTPMDTVCYSNFINSTDVDSRIKVYQDQWVTPWPYFAMAGFIIAIPSTVEAILLFVKWFFRLD